jgi:fumarylacetoacetate (FAA) hydrolase
MKFATLKSEHRDGVCCFVNSDATQFIKIDDIAPTLQFALENWHQIYPALQNRYHAFLQGEIMGKRFNPDLMHCPLPRAYQWLDGSAYLHHVQLVRKARGAEMPKEFLTDPLMYQGGSDDFTPPTSPIPVTSETYGIDFEAEVCVITDNVPMGSTPLECASKILLILLVNDVTLRELIPQELSKGFGFLHGKPSSSFSPIAVTPDELGKAWDGYRVHLPLISTLNHKPFGSPNAGIGMQFSFPELIAHAAKTRYLTAGTIIGSGTVSNDDKEVGSSCIVEQRMIEIIETGKPSTPYMHFGDNIRIEMFNDKHESIFGAIDQTISRYHKES